jgi:hypothetical protein
LHEISSEFFFQTKQKKKSFKLEKKHAKLSNLRRKKMEHTVNSETIMPIRLHASESESDSDSLIFDISEGIYRAYFDRFRNNTEINSVDADSTASATASVSSPSTINSYDYDYDDYYYENNNFENDDDETVRPVVIGQQCVVEIEPLSQAIKKQRGWSNLD